MPGNVPDDPLRSIVAGTATITGDAYFHSLVRHLASALEVRCALVAELPKGGSDLVATLAVWDRDGFTENFEYALAGTPCENVVQQTLCFYPSDIQRLFPRDRVLVDMGAESYLASPLPDSSGQALGLLAVIDDRPMEDDPQARDLLTIFASRAGMELERQRSEAKLRASEERTRRIVEGALDAVITIDAEGVVTGWSARASATFGWSEEEALGRTLAELIIPEENREPHRAGLERFAETGEGPLLGQRVEIDGLHRDGHRIPLELSIATIQTGGSHEFSAFVRDLTRRRQNEEARRKLEARIQDAQKAESLAVLAGGIAHDFNNLLTGILSHAGTARRQLAPDSSVQQALAHVVQGSKLAAHLTGQLLAYAGKGSFEVRPLDLSAEVRGLESLLQSQVRAPARLELDLADPLPAIAADPVQVHQILLNLVINGAESLEENGSVRIRTRAVELSAPEIDELVAGSAAQPGPHVALEVEDNGCGMDAETLGRIFDPFFTTKKTGRGLGLAAALGIVHRHGGSIHVDSSPGAGTRFRVAFPVSEGDPRAVERRAQGDLSGRGLVLVVDDDAYVLQGVYYALESYGYSVILAESGEAAVEFYRRRSEEIDLVLLDMTMPGMGGVETFKALRAIRPDVRVLVATGYDQQEAARQFAHEQLAGFLRKPYDPEDLAAEVKRLLGAAPGVPAEALALDPLEALRASYRRELPEKLDALEAAVRAARDGGDRDEARDLAHTLKGTCGFYGFDTLSTALEGVEERLGSAEEVDWDELDQALHRTRSSLPKRA